MGCLYEFLPFLLQDLQCNFIEQKIHKREFQDFLIFFKDEFPLASLPLLGYSVTTPSATDNISKDFVLKLQFKNHVYFFRSDSQYSFDR